MAGGGICHIGCFVVGVLSNTRTTLLYSVCVLEEVFYCEAFVALESFDAGNFVIGILSRGFYQ